MKLKLLLAVFVTAILIPTTTTHAVEYKEGEVFETQISPTSYYTVSIPATTLIDNQSQSGKCDVTVSGTIDSDKVVIVNTVSSEESEQCKIVLSNTKKTEDKCILTVDNPTLVFYPADLTETGESVKSIHMKIDENKEGCFSGDINLIFHSEINTDVAHEHEPVPYETVDKTCTADGYILYMCSCGYNYEETIPAGHEFESGKCKVCGEVDESYTTEVLTTEVETSTESELSTETTTELETTTEVPTTETETMTEVPTTEVETETESNTSTTEVETETKSSTEIATETEPEPDTSTTEITTESDSSTTEVETSTEVSASTEIETEPISSTEVAASTEPVSQTESSMPEESESILTEVESISLE